MINLELLVNNRYRLQRRIAGGGFGVVYEGLDLEARNEVAIKLEHTRTDPSVLENEFQIYNDLIGGLGIPQAYWHGQEGEFRVMVIELLGPSLEDLLYYCRRKFSLKTVLLLADQLIQRFEYIHSKGYIHRDVKPQNLLVDNGIQGNTVYVGDFGLATEFRDVGRGREVRRRTVSLIGTARYASINAHSGVELSQRDDMDSLGYVLIYFLRGSLPWQGLKAETEQQENELILEKKKTISIQELCEGLPKEFEMYFEHVRFLRFDQNADYIFLRGIFRNLFLRESYKYDGVFDWTVVKLLEHMERTRKLPEPSA